MDRSDLQRLTKEELIDLVLRMQRPEKTSRTSSKPPSSDSKERRDKAKPGGAKPGHEGHSRAMSEDFDHIVDHHHPDQCPCCRASLPRDLPAEAVSEHDKIELPAIEPLIERHRRLAVRCPSCGTLVVAALPDAAKGTPFGPRVHAVATYLKTFQALSYERLQGAFADLFGLTISQGGLMNMLRREQGVFVAERDSAVAALRQAKVIASDETRVRIEGSNAYHWVFSLRASRCPSGRSDARRRRGPHSDGRASTRRLVFRSLCRATGSCDSAPDLPGASGPRCRLCRRGK